MLPQQPAITGATVCPRASDAVWLQAQTRLDSSMLLHRNHDTRIYDVADGSARLSDCRAEHQEAGEGRFRHQEAPDHPLSLPRSRGC